jgi:hypothetical protein
MVVGFWDEKRAPVAALVLAQLAAVYAFNVMLPEIPGATLA